jgi:hypothetical protein
VNRCVAVRSQNNKEKAADYRKKNDEYSEYESTKTQKFVAYWEEIDKILKHAPALCVKDISRDEALEIKNKLDLAAKAKARGQPVKPPAWEQRDEGRMLTHVTQLCRVLGDVIHSGVCLPVRDYRASHSHTYECALLCVCVCVCVSDFQPCWHCASSSH